MVGGAPWWPICSGILGSGPEDTENDRPPPTLEWRGYAPPAGWWSRTGVSPVPPLDWHPWVAPAFLAGATS